MDDYGLLGHLLKTVTNCQLLQYLDEIDTVRQTHEVCLPCSLKLLAFCCSFSDGRLPKHFSRYSAEYKKLLAIYPSQRDFMHEIRIAIDKSNPVSVPKTGLNMTLCGWLGVDLGG